MSKGQSLQDPFLNALRRDRIPVAIYLVNGIKLQGTVESFDQFVVLLRNQVSQMVYKHAISTVVPSRSVRITGSEFQSGDASPPERSRNEPGRVESESNAPERPPAQPAGEDPVAESPVAER